MLWDQIPLAELLFVEGTGELFPFEVGVLGLAFAFAVAAYRKIREHQNNNNNNTNYLLLRVDCIPRFQPRHTKFHHIINDLYQQKISEITMSVNNNLQLH